MKKNRLQFSDLVKPAYILPDLRADDREEALTKMASRLVETGYCEPTFIQAILDRETMHPSGLPMPGPKIAIPHTDAIHVRQSIILFARLQKPVEFQSMGSPDDKLSLRLISMFALKEKNRIGDMLETLISVYQNEHILKSILNASEGKDIYQILKDSVGKYDA